MGPTLLVVWGEGLGRCEPENTPEMQKCPKTFVHDCRMTGMTGETRVAIKCEIWRLMALTSEKSVLVVDFEKSKSGFHRFPFYHSIWKSKIQYAKPFSWKVVFFLLIMRAHARPLFLRTVFQFFFQISKSKERKGIQEQLSLSIEIRFPILCLIANPKSGF